MKLSSLLLVLCALGHALALVRKGDGANLSRKGTNWVTTKEDAQNAMPMEEKNAKAQRKGRVHVKKRRRLVREHGLFQCLNLTLVLSYDKG